MKREQLFPALLRILHAAVLLLDVVDFLTELLSLELYLSLGIAAALLLLGQLWRPERAIPLSIPAFGLCFATAICQDRRGLSAALAGLFALLTLLCYLLSMHGQNMRAGLHNMPGEVPMKWPRGVRLKNALLVLLFLGLAFGLGSIRAVERSADRLWRLAATGVEHSAANTAASIKAKAIASPKPTPTPRPTPAPEEREEEEYHPVSPLVVLFFLPVFLLGAVFLVGLFFLPKELRRLRGRLRDRRRNKRKRGEGTEDYEEEQEKLRDWHELLATAGKRLRPRRREAKRKRRWEDLPDDRARVRYAWLRLQTSPAGKQYGAALTPRELGQAMGIEEIKALSEQYNLARYAPGAALSTEAGETAAEVLRLIRTRKRIKKDRPKEQKSRENLAPEQLIRMLNRQ